MLKAIHPSEDRQAARDKAQAVVAELKLPCAVKKVEGRIEKTLSDYEFPSAHWCRLRTNTPLELILREVRQRTRVTEAFPYGNSAQMLLATRLRHISKTR